MRSCRCALPVPSRVRTFSPSAQSRLPRPRTGSSPAMASPPATIEQLARETRRRSPILRPRCARSPRYAGSSMPPSPRSSDGRCRAAPRGARSPGPWASPSRPPIGSTATCSSSRWARCRRSADPRAATEARRSIQFAREEAARLGQPAIGTEHILLGILRCQRSLGVKALNAWASRWSRPGGCLQTTCPASARRAERPPRNTGHRAGADGSRARRAARPRERGERLVGVEHLLLALLSDSRNGAVQTLESMRTTPAKVRRQLELECAAAGVSPAPRATRRAEPGAPCRRRSSADLAQPSGLDLVDEPADRVLARDERGGLDPRDRLAHVGVEISECLGRPLRLDPRVLLDRRA